MHTRVFGLTVPIAAVTAVLITAAPAWAGTVQIQDDAHVLNATAVQNDAATLPVGVYIWATTQDADSTSAFDTDVRNKVTATFPVVIGINTQSRHETIQIGSRAGLSQSAARAAESSANSAFLSTIRGSHDYTAAVTAAVDNLRSGFASAHRTRGPVQRVPAQSSGSGLGLLLILLLLGAIVVVALLAFRRRRSRQGPLSTFAGPPPMGPPPMGPYPDYGDPSYRGPHRSGMSPGAAGVLGAAGGGLLGYELGKMHGEQEQFREDEMMDNRDRGTPYDTGDQGDWVVGQDSDFGEGGGGDPNAGGSGQW